MERSQLKYVVEVAKTGNITKAAEELHIAQPSLSNQILNLERELGISLFERTRKRVYLTDAGEVFVEQAKQILNDMDHLKETMKEYADRRLGKVRVGALSVMVALEISEAIATFSETYKDIDLFLEESGSSELLKRVKQSELDAAFVILPKGYQDEEIKTIKLMESQYMAIVNKKNPLCTKGKLMIEDFRDQNLIFMANNFTLQRLLISALEQQNVPYRVSTVCNQIDTSFALADRNFGIGFCSATSADYYKYENVNFIPVEGVAIRTIYLVYKKNPKYHPALQMFIDYVKEYYEINM